MVGIICPLIEIGLTVWPKTGGFSPCLRRHCNILKFRSWCYLTSKLSGRCHQPFVTFSEYNIWFHEVPIPNLEWLFWQTKNKQVRKFGIRNWEIGNLWNHVVSCSNAMIQEEIDVDLTGFKNYFWIYPNNYVHGFKWNAINRHLFLLEDYRCGKMNTP